MQDENFNDNSICRRLLVSRTVQRYSTKSSLARVRRCNVGYSGNESASKVDGTCTVRVSLEQGNKLVRPRLDGTKGVQIHMHQIEREGRNQSGIGNVTDQALVEGNVKRAIAYLVTE
jgi:hypothetical protein